MMQDDELLSMARMGIDAESFMRTPLGKFLLKKADDEIAAATEELIDAAPDDVKVATEIRNRIHVARMFKVWMSDAITIGHSAHDQLRELEGM